MARRPNASFPAGIELRSHLPALRYALRLARQREEKMADRFEPIGLEDAREARRELEALVEAIGGPTT